MITSFPAKPFLILLTLSDGSNIGIYLKASGGFWAVSGIILLLLIQQAINTALGTI